MRTHSFKIISFLIGSAMAFCLAELFFRYLDRKETLHIQQRWRQYKNLYVEDIRSGENSSCNFTDSLKPHPFLSYVHTDSGNCAISANSNGFMLTHEIPLERPKDRFVILVTGGSVASQFAQYSDLDKRNDFEDYLNTHFISPNEKPFQIINAALGEWALPVPYNITGLFGNRVHAVISLLGYNEAVNIYSAKNFESATLNFFVLTGNNFSAPLLFINLIRKMRPIILQTPLKKSHFAFWLYKTSLDILASPISGLMETHFDLNGKQFSIPHDWKEEQVWDWNRNSMKHYIAGMNAVMKSNKGYYANFIQPTRLNGKPLTSDEKSFPEYTDKKIYMNVVIRASEELKKNGVPSFLLTDIFQNHREQIYGDHIHFLRYQADKSYGNKILAEAMAKQIAKSWGLRAK